VALAALPASQKIADAVDLSNQFTGFDDPTRKMDALEGGMGTRRGRSWYVCSVPAN
jgi:hypothetical protein